MFSFCLSCLELKPISINLETIIDLVLFVISRVFHVEFYYTEKVNCYWSNIEIMKATIFGNL